MSSLEECFLNCSINFLIIKLSYVSLYTEFISKLKDDQKKNSSYTKEVHKKTEDLRLYHERIIKDFPKIMSHQIPIFKIINSLFSYIYYKILEMDVPTCENYIETHFEKLCFMGYRNNRLISFLSDIIKETEQKGYFSFDNVVIYFNSLLECRDSYRYHLRKLDETREKLFPSGQDSILFSFYKKSKEDDFNFFSK